jgi:hypothetical protein
MKAGAAAQFILSAGEQSICADVLDHLCRTIGSVEISSWPYAHFYLEGIFPDDVFAQILERLPNPDAYTPDNPRIHTREDGLVTRNIFSLSPHGILHLAEPHRSFWGQLGDALTSRRLRDVVFAKLSTDLSRRFGIPADQLHSIDAYPKPALVKDLGGYEIAPHRDTRSKIVTMQFYLPNDMLKIDLGTTVYRQRLFRIKNLVSPKNRFEVVKQFAFAPNTGYGFAVGRRSWHGREKVPVASGERNSLMLIYYARPDKGW